MHGLSASSESIKSADTLVKVWTEFVKFIEKYTSEKMGIIVAWGGKSYDIKWMWKITEETHVGECIMPKNCEFFLDPIDTMKLLPKDHPRWDPLQKIQPILDLLLKQLALAYVLGDRLSIDEAMIKYCGKFVSFVQYMPKKPTITLLLLLVEFLHRLPIDTEIMKYSS